MVTPSILDYNVLARIDSMQMLAKVVVEGFVLGLHRSPYRGFSVEFAEYRQYSPGDEVKHVDWKVYGKTDRYYIKQFEEETNLACYLVVDASASMGYRFAPEGLTKLQYASQIAACLAYFMMRQRDAAGLMLFDTKIRTALPPRMRQTHLKRILSALEQAQPGGETDIAGPLHQLAEGLKRKGLIILISDLLDDPAKIISALQHFRFQGHEVIVFQVLDNGELTFPFTTMTEFTDLETGRKTMISPEGMKPIYLKELRQFLDACEKGCAGIHADYKMLDTSKPLEVALSEYLYRRSRLG
ncbi:MAG: DUF58 domain-containing protein [Chthoniobacteraceae bacterium]|nr:DUF58 domain-containing protein [Chthoniobacteraceae bacterium]